MRVRLSSVMPIVKTAIGCAIFGLSFHVFLLPNDLNVGGLSGLSMILVHLAGAGSIGFVTLLLNIPLFIFAGLRIGKRFFLLSLAGTLFSSVFLDVMSVFPSLETEPLVGCLYGGALCGFGLGLVFSAGASTGGSDIIVRFVKRLRPDLPLGTVAIFMDMLVAVLNGVFLGDISRTLYSGIAIFISGRVVDAVVYRFDYSRVAWIISKHYDQIVDVIARELGRGATLLHAEGSYSHMETRVVLTAVRRQQLSDLKRMVSLVDPDAFVIVQEAHQVLGSGFLRYSGDF